MGILYLVASLLGKLLIGLIGLAAVVATLTALAVAARDAYRERRP